MSKALSLDLRERMIAPAVEDEAAEATSAMAAPASRGAGLTLAERAGVIEIDLPDGVRIRLDGGVSEKPLRRVLEALQAIR